MTGVPALLGRAVTAYCHLQLPTGKGYEVCAMADFTPLSGFVGGAMIGLSAALLMLFVGRIAGISGILGDLLSPAANYRDWRIAFLGGLLAAPLLYGLVGAL